MTTVIKPEIAGIHLADNLLDKFKSIDSAIGSLDKSSKNNIKTDTEQSTKITANETKITENLAKIQTNITNIASNLSKIEGNTTEITAIKNNFKL